MAKNLKGKINPVAGAALENRKPSGRYGKDGNNKPTKSIGLGDGPIPADGMKMPAYDGPIPQHHEYAITGRANEAERFGVLSHDHKNRPHSEPLTSRRPALKDSKRAHPKPRGFHQHPDHGPTGHDGP